MTPEHDRADEELESLLRAMPCLPPAQEHREELRRRVLETFDRTALGAASPPWRAALQKGAAVMRHPFSRLVVATAAAVLVGVWLFWPSPTFALSDLITPIVEAKSAKFEMTVKNELQPKEMTGTGYFLAPNRFRQEFGEMVNISDLDRGRMMTLNPAVKQAYIIDLKGRRDPDKPAENYFSDLRSLLARHKQDKAGDVEDLGQKEIDGRKAFGFRLAAPAQIVTLWGDVESGRLVRIECEMAGPPKTDVVFSKITFDVELDASLFPYDPPEGYKAITTEFDVSPPAEQDFLAALTRLTSPKDGSFPAGFDSPAIAAAIAKLALQGGAEPDDSAEAGKQMMQTALLVGRGLSFALQLPPEADAHYAGKGVKRGGPKTAIFWYKPEGRPVYRIIWNDLSVTEAESAPKVEGAFPIHRKLPAKTPEG
jgi:outer membrane lipoprotein-sorting protein